MTESNDTYSEFGPPTVSEPPPAYPVTTTFFVVRHAESQSQSSGYFGGPSDLSLSELGQQQARALADAFANTALDAVLSSDLSRATATVEPMATRRNLSVSQTPLLRERNMGVITGMSFQEVRTRHPDLWSRLMARDPTTAPPGGESQYHVADRVRRFLNATITRHRGRSVVVCAHAGLVSHLLRLLMGIQDLAIPLWFEPGPGSVSRIDVVEPKPGVITPKIVYINRVLPVGRTAVLP